MPFTLHCNHTVSLDLQFADAVDLCDGNQMVLNLRQRDRILANCCALVTYTPVSARHAQAD